MGFALIHWTLPYKGNSFKAAIKGATVERLGGEHKWKGDPKAAPVPSVSP